MKYVIDAITAEGENVIGEPVDFVEAVTQFCDICDIDHIAAIEEGQEETGLSYEGSFVKMRPAYPSELCNNDGPLDLEPYIDQMHPARFKTAWLRTEKEFGGLIVDPESEAVSKTYHDHLKRLALEDLTRELVNSGNLKADVLKDGQLFYSIP